jgi:hypothetical protein
MHIKTILPPVLCEYEIWSSTLMEEQRLWAFETRVLWKIFGQKQQDVTQEWRKLHDEDLYDSCYLPNIIWVIKSKRMRWTVYVASMGIKKNSHRLFLAKHEGKRLFGRPRCRWAVKITLDIMEKRWEGSGYGPRVDSCEHGNEHLGSISCRKFLE